MANEKYLQERFEEHNMKVSYLYPEVHDRLKNRHFPRHYRVLHDITRFSSLFLGQFLFEIHQRLSIRSFGRRVLPLLLPNRLYTE